MARIYNTSVRRGEYFVRYFSEKVDNEPQDISAYTPTVEWKDNTGTLPAESTIELSDAFTARWVVDSEATSEMVSGGDYTIWLVDEDENRRELISGYVTLVGEPHE